MYEYFYYSIRQNNLALFKMYYHKFEHYLKANSSGIFIFLCLIKISLAMLKKYKFSRWSILFNWFKGVDWSVDIGVIVTQNSGKLNILPNLPFRHIKGFFRNNTIDFLQVKL